MLINKRDELKIVLNSAKVCPRIIAITEITQKFSTPATIVSEFELEWYNIFCSSLGNNNSRGVLIYVAVDLEASLVDIPTALEECLFINVKSSSRSSNKILIGNIYRSPNSSQNNDDNLYELSEYIEQNFNTPKLLVGAFNFSSTQPPCSIILRFKTAGINITSDVKSQFLRHALPFPLM